MVLWLTQRFGPMATQARKRPLDGPLAAEDEEQKRLKLADESEKIRREINTAGMKQDARKALELFDEAVERDPDTNFCKIILYFVLETRPPPGASFFLTPPLRWPPSPPPCPRTGPLPAYTSVPRAG